MVEVFMCHKREDRQFVINFAKGLQFYGVKCWFDGAEMLPGDDLIDKISQAIEKCDFFLAFVSIDSVKSNWVKYELSKAMRKEIATGKPFVIPVKIDHCEIPSSLSHKIYADLTKPERRLYELRRILKQIKKPEEHKVIESKQKHLEKAEIESLEKKLKELFESLKYVAEDYEKKFFTYIEEKEEEKEGGKKAEEPIPEIKSQNEERRKKPVDDLTSTAIAVENDVDKGKHVEGIKKPNSKNHIEEIKKRKEEKPRSLTEDLKYEVKNMKNRQAVKKPIQVRKRPTDIGTIAVELGNIADYSLELEVSLSKKSEQGVYIFKLSGNLGIDSSRRLSRLFEACLKEKVYKIIIDLTEICFVCEHGMDVFFFAAGDLRENGGDIIILRKHNKIKDIFYPLHVPDFFESYNSEEEAVKALDSGAKVKSAKKTP